jgi:hypothetical protein
MWSNIKRCSTRGGEVVCDLMMQTPSQCRGHVFVDGFPDEIVVEAKSLPLLPQET